MVHQLIYVNLSIYGDTTVINCDEQWFKRVVINHGSQRFVINHGPTNSCFFDGIASRRRLQFVIEYTSLLAGKINEPSAPCSMAMLLYGTNCQSV